MNIDWEEELEEYFKPQYIKTHERIKEAHYKLTTL